LEKFGYWESFWEILDWSDETRVSSPKQGSVLGTILFIIHINDLEEELSRKIMKFANDTKLVKK